MPKARDLLGMNARNQLYTALNSPMAKRYGTSKYATKILLEDQHIPTAKLYGVLGTMEDVNEFPWETMEKNFVIKPSNGNAGKGVAIFRTQEVDKLHWRNTMGRKWSLEDIKLHCADILEGIYSTYGQNPSIIVEERVPIHTKFQKYAYKGTPDVRVIVFNHVPVMSMLRLPTRQSEGRANLHQGALAAGIDLFSGTTNFAITGDGQPIQFIPDTEKKLSGIQIPEWKQVLEIAVKAADAANLIFCGVDLFVHEEKGPLVVELNANPGLSIQLANHSGLRRRLERVQDIHVLNPEHGARIGQALFAESFPDRIKAEDGLTIISPFEEIQVYDQEKNKKPISALIDTGRFRSAIASSLAKELKLVEPTDLLWYQQEKDERVPVVEVVFRLKGRKRTTAMIVSKSLNKAKYLIQIGRNDLAGFLVGEKQN